MESPVSLTNLEMSLKNRNTHTFVVPSAHQLLLGCRVSAFCLVGEAFASVSPENQIKKQQKDQIEIPWISGKIWSWEEHWLLEQSARRCWGSSHDSHPIKTIVSEFLDGDNCGFWLSCSGLFLPKSSLNESTIWLWLTSLYSYPVKVCRDFCFNVLCKVRGDNFIFLIRL